MLKVGLTGSIGMGKSTTAGMFRALGVPVYDADATVARLYAPGGAAVPHIAALWPDAVVKGGVDRRRLSAAVVGDSDAMKRLEAIVHPLTATEKDKFLARAEEEGRRLVVLDIPLLFETGGDKTVDKIIVATAPLTAQRARVLARPGMTPEKFDALLARQLPDAEKRARADYVVDTSLGRGVARRDVARISADLRTGDA